MKRALSRVTVLALVVPVLAGCSGGNQPAAPSAGSTVQAGITARGLATVTGTPDTVTVVIGVQTRGPSAKGTLDANSAQATALIDALKAKGVTAADLRTSQLSINPTYDSATRRITGYEVTNQVTATLRNISGAGELIDAASAAAGDAVRVQQLGFSIDDDSASRAQARADAVRQATAQAKQLADAAGVTLGRLHSITEVPVNPPGPVFRDSAPAADAAAVPLEPGTQKLTVMVEVVYDIDQ
ncbi:MAG TPA: SIMPL domain-containing protein [Pseudonocardiaceae bacterium]|nr:SIMPL domain-containing protein [Pseudonocardiaceae bacterium]